MSMRILSFFFINQKKSIPICNRNATTFFFPFFFHMDANLENDAQDKHFDYKTDTKIEFEYFFDKEIFLSESYLMLIFL